MSDADYSMTRVGDLERVPLEGFAWRPVRRALGVTAFGINGYTADAGQEVIEPHDETSDGAGGHEEVYVVISGAATFTVGGERLSAPAGTLVRVGVSTHREAVADADETTVLVIGGVPGSALPASPFEHWYAAQAPYARGDYEDAIAVASEGLADYPDHPTLQYQLACYNALAGHRAQALEHLRNAVAGNPRAQAWAADDSDLDSIRSQPEFPRG